MLTVIAFMGWEGGTRRGMSAERAGQLKTSTNELTTRSRTKLEHLCQTRDRMKFGGRVAPPRQIVRVNANCKGRPGFRPVSGSETRGRAK